MMNRLTIRKCENRDFSLLENFAQNWLTAKEFWSFEEIKASLAQKENELWLAFVNETNLIGILFFNVVLDFSDLLFIYIEPKNRSSGHGKKLMDHYMTRAKKHKVKKLFLEVRGNNQTARDFYDSLGYKVIRTIKNYYSDGDNGIVMEKSL